MRLTNIIYIIIIFSILMAGCQDVQPNVFETDANALSRDGKLWLFIQFHVGSRTDLTDRKLEPVVSDSGIIDQRLYTDVASSNPVFITTVLKNGSFTFSTEDDWWAKEHKLSVEQLRTQFLECYVKNKGTYLKSNEPLDSKPYKYKVHINTHVQISYWSNIEINKPFLSIGKGSYMYDYMP
jgi:hypothetical protein